MDRYRGLFLEEASEHLADMSRALLVLEKDSASVESIDVMFRMAHSIKSMAATLAYDSISEVSHALEDHMEGIRTAARVEGPEALALLFSGLEALEEMVEVVRGTGESAPARPELVEALSGAELARAASELPADPASSDSELDSPREREPTKKV